MPSPYLNTKEAAEFLRYKSVSGFKKAVRRYDIPRIERGREKLFLKADLISVWTLPSRRKRKDDAA